MTADDRPPAADAPPGARRPPGDAASAGDHTLISPPPEPPRGSVPDGPEDDLEDAAPPPPDAHAVDDAEHESLVEEVLRRRRAERAREALVSPWSAGRARRLRIAALVLVVVGPVLGSLFALWIIPSGSADEVSATPSEPAQLAIRATVRNVDATAAEANVRLVPGEPMGGSPLFEGGVLDEDVTLVVNDATGESIRVLPAGQPPGALSVTVPLTGSRVTRYPLDSYRAIVLVQAKVEGDGAEGDGDGDGDTVPVDLTVSTNDPLFSTSAGEVTATSSASVVFLDVERRFTGIGWAVFFVVLCWMLAIAAASIGWVTIVHGFPTPVWGWAFLIGVLFALPPLRASLPGTPPGGSLVDFAAFYWAVGIVAFTLVALVGSWNVRVRRWPDSPDAPRPPL